MGNTGVCVCSAMQSKLKPGSHALRSEDSASRLLTVTKIMSVRSCFLCYEHEKQRLRCRTRTSSQTRGAACTGRILGRRGCRVSCWRAAHGLSMGRPISPGKLGGPGGTTGRRPSVQAYAYAREDCAALAPG